MLPSKRTGSLKQTSKWSFYGIYLPCQFSWWSLNFLKIRLPQLKLEYLNHWYSKFWYKSRSWWHVLLRKKNVINDTKWIQEIMLQMIRVVQKWYLCRNSSHVLILSLQSIVITQILFGISNKKIATYDTIENPK